MGNFIKKGTTAVIFILCVFARLSFAHESTDKIPSISGFTKSDRVLVLAPHPDDEAIGVAGAIQHALEAGAAVYVACYTNGDANQLAFIVYEKRLTFRKGEFVHMGEVRRKETLAAMKFLGVDEENIFFMGYPDFGTMQIMFKYWGPTAPYRSLFTKAGNVPYKENLSPNALYVGESILKDIETVLLRVKPAKIFVSHPADTNGDHQSLYLFLRVALWNLCDKDKKLKTPQVYPYMVHCIGWPKPRGYRPEKELSPPEGFVSGQIKWQKLVLKDAEVSKKDRAAGFYKSQIPYNPSYLHTFSRKNELFGDYTQLKIKESPGRNLNWQASYGPDDAAKDYSAAAAKEGKGEDVVFIYYAKKDSKLYIKLSLTRKITKAVKSSIHLLPYSFKRDFADMPKLRLLITRRSLVIYDQKTRIFVKDADMRVENKDSIIIKLPLATLNFPDFVLSKVRAHTDTAPSDAYSWRALELDK